MNREKLGFDTRWVSDSIFKFWSFWPQSQGLPSTSGLLCPDGKNFTDYALKQPKLLNLVIWMSEKWSFAKYVCSMQQGHVFVWFPLVMGIGSRVGPWPLQAYETVDQEAEWYLAFSNVDSFFFCCVFLKNSEEKFIPMRHSSQGFSWVLKGHLGSGAECMYRGQVNYVALATTALVFPD